jgi:hypothetical protein
MSNRAAGAHRTMPAMETASQIAVRLSRASCRKFYDVYNAFDWPERLEPGMWCMPPELVSLHGTPVWDSLDEATQKRVSLFEMANLFSLVLHGERLLVAGLAHRLHSPKHPAEITDYLHHFLDEENKHMVMFGTFCQRYAGRVYPDKKLPLPKEMDAGQEEVAFYCMAMVVEELGDHYNVLVGQDERVDPLVRRINKVHHIDEARHLAFGRLHLAELFERHSPGWTPEQLDGFRTWLAHFLRAAWADYYNPGVYRDAGLHEPYELRQMALAHPASVARRRQGSSRLIGYFLRTGLLNEAPLL